MEVQISALPTKGLWEYAKKKTKFILFTPTKIRIGCAGIHAPDHGLKQNSVGVSYTYTLKNLCMRL